MHAQYLTKLSKVKDLNYTVDSIYIKSTFAARFGLCCPIDSCLCQILLSSGSRVISGAVTSVFGGVTLLWDVYQLRGGVKDLAAGMKSGGAHVSTSCYLNPGLLYTMHTLRFHMILMHDQQNLLTPSNYILYAPKPSCNIQCVKRKREREK